MKRYQSTYGIWVWFLVDGASWFLAMWIALAMRFPQGIPAIEWEFFVRFIPLSGAAIMGSFLYAGVYRRDLAEKWNWKSVWWGSLYGLGLSLAVLFLLKIPYSRFAFGVGFIIFVLFVGTLRVGWNVLSGYIGLDHKTRVHAYGFKNQATRQELETKLNDRIELNFFNIEHVSKVEDLQENLPDVIVLNGSTLEADSLRDFFDYGSRRQIPVRCYPSTEQVLLAQSDLTSWNNALFLRSRLHHLVQQQMALKTVFDYMVGSLLMLLALPVIGFTALLIAIIDGFPVLYTQERTGRGGERFTLYKFRTMIPDAENKGPSLTQGENDPRITSLGRFLRRWSLDELPQLFNVLKGDMSLVGPRPEIPSITQDYEEQEQRLLWLKPGLTGLSQVSGRQELELDRKLKIDQYYLSEYSISLDLWILLKTVYVVITGRGSA